MNEAIPVHAVLRIEIRKGISKLPFRSRILMIMTITMKTGTGAAQMNLSIRSEIISTFLPRFQPTP